jgi:transposase
MPTIASSSRWRVPENPPSSPRQNRTAPRQFDEVLYQTRHLIENFFCKLKQFRGIATRYDKTARNFLAALHLAAATIWLI